MIQIDNKSIANSVFDGTKGLSAAWVRGYSDCNIDTINPELVYEIMGEKPLKEELITERELCKKLNLTAGQFRRINAPYYSIGGKKRYSLSQTIDYMLAMKPCLVVNETSFKYKTASDIVVAIVNSKDMDFGLQPFERVVLNEYFKWGYTIGEIARNYSTDSTHIKNVYQYAIRKIKTKLL